eukprot:TRINITY_DN16965_c0_g1_i2.p1 TRINITY_DN16965_c0_g1~~TRINITY_DN16965_c0_g1_i2.p1  ORF type:complete len:331 (+),score=67.63 TRINITY_DN16965_c0_g1_i2:29-994(+)
MAPQNPWVPQGQQVGELYALPSSSSPLIVRSEQRMKLMNTWRHQKRYRLSMEEKQALDTVMSKQGMWTGCTYVGLIGTWWVTGNRNTEAFYKSFGVGKELTDSLLKLQPMKLQWHIAARGLACIVSTIPFTVLLAQAQDKYFIDMCDSKTIFGGFARYLRQQGDRMENGEAIERYIYGNVYLEKVEKKMKDAGRRRGKRDEGEMIIGDVTFNTAPPVELEDKDLVKDHSKVFHEEPLPPPPSSSTKNQRKIDWDNLDEPADYTPPESPNLDNEDAFTAPPPLVAQPLLFREAPLPQLRIVAPDANPTTLWMDHVFGPVAKA